VVALENSSAELSCYTFGVPEPSVTWHKGTTYELTSEELPQDGNRLIIYPVKKADRGIYYCVADNGVGTPAIRNVSLDVEFFPMVQGGGQVNHYVKQLTSNAHLLIVLVGVINLIRVLSI